MSDNETEQYEAYQKDTRIPCRYGAKCYQKNAVHHKTYKHPPAKDVKKQKAIKRTVHQKKRKKQESNEPSSDSPDKKIQKKDEKSIAHTVDNNTIKSVNEENNEEERLSLNNIKCVKDSCDQVTIASLLKNCDINVETDTLFLTDAQTVIFHLFLTEMPEDFFEFYEFCKSISEKDPLNALNDLGLHLVGPYSVFGNKFLSSKVDDKKTLLRHWRYYYDPPEFQTIIKIDGKDDLHFGYWRDDPAEKPVFVAKNRANVNCVIESVAENIFGALDVHIGEKLKLANPFEKTRLAQLHQRLKNYAKEKNITLDRKTSNMQAREKKVVARTFHKAGIVVPYNKKTELGYRDLAVTDHELEKKILKEIEQASTPEAKKVPMSKLEEVIRLATIAADECDFGTCLELGHDLFSSGVNFIQNKVLNMLSLAYNLLQRPQFLEIARAHLEDRKKGSNLSVLRL